MISYYVVCDNEIYGPYYSIVDCENVAAPGKQKIIQSDSKGRFFHDGSEHSPIPKDTIVSYVAKSGIKFRRFPASDVHWPHVRFYFFDDENKDDCNEDCDKMNSEGKFYEALVDGEWITAELLKKQHDDLYAVMIYYGDEGIPELCWASEIREIDPRCEALVKEVFDAVPLKELSQIEAELFLRDIYDQIKNGKISTLAIK